MEEAPKWELDFVERPLHTLAIVRIGSDTRGSFQIHNEADRSFWEGVKQHMRLTQENVRTDPIINRGA